MAQRNEDIRSVSSVSAGVEAEATTPAPGTVAGHGAAGAEGEVAESVAVEVEAEHDQAAWGYGRPPESRWPVALAVLVALALYYTVPEELTPGPNWLVPALELAVIIPLNIVSPRITPSRGRRRVVILLLGAISLANLVALVLLIQELLRGHGVPGHPQLDGRTLIIAAIHIWLTNVIIFGLWYWILDRGGPTERMSPGHRQPDFLFPQMATPEAEPGWAPGLVDYLFVSFTNSTAFSPTDTMPLTPWAKALMLVQALASLLTIALVAARAVNILS